jgi:hypothetical protein
MLLSDSSSCIWATDGGLLADSSTRFPGASSYRYYTEKYPSKVRENGRESSLCGESMKIPSKVGNATLREKLPHNFVGITSSISE